MRVGLKLIGVALLLLAGACERAPQTTGSAQMNANQPPVATTISAKYQRELLELAMEAASSIPIQPHIKDRCRAQGQVVTTALQLDLISEAQSYVERISDWRRGEGYGDLAIYTARHGAQAAALQYIAKAERISSAQGLEEWRRDAIRVKLAQAQVFLGNDDLAKKVESGLDVADIARVGSARATQSEDASFDLQLKSIYAMTGGTDLDATQSALVSSLRLYDRYYGEATRRAESEQAIRKNWSKLPVYLRIDLLLNLADVAIDHQDHSSARALVEEADTQVKGATWRIEDITPVAARLVQYRFRAGSTGTASEELKVILAKYQSEKEQMLNIERVTALLPVAEAYLLTGDGTGALRVYALCAEESVVNPNSRPRALDLAAICRAMALANCEPDQSLWTRLREIRKGLSDPW